MHDAWNNAIFAREIPYFSVPKSAALNFQASVTCKQALGGGGGRDRFLFPFTTPAPWKTVKHARTGKKSQSKFYQISNYTHLY